MGSGVGGGVPALAAGLLRVGFGKSRAAWLPRGWGSGGLAATGIGLYAPDRGACVLGFAEAVARERLQATRRCILREPCAKKRSERGAVVATARVGALSSSPGANCQRITTGERLRWESRACTAAWARTPHPRGTCPRPEWPRSERLCSLGPPEVSIYTRRDLTRSRQDEVQDNRAGDADRLLRLAR